MTAKQQAIQLIQKLPSDATLEDIQYHLYVIQSVAKGRADAKANRVLSHKKVAEILRRRWLTDKGR